MSKKKIAHFWHGIQIETDIREMSNTQEEKTAAEHSNETVIYYHPFSDHD